MLAALALFASLATLPTEGMTIDCDHDGTDEQLRYQTSTFSLDGEVSTPIANVPRSINLSGESKGGYGFCQIDLVRERARSESLLFVRVPQKGWTFVESLPFRQDAEAKTVVGADAAGVLRYQIAPGTTRCDGEGRIDVVRYDAGAKAWRPYALPFPVGTGLGTAPLGGAPHRSLLRAGAASAEAGVAVADRGAPTELDDASPETVWRWETPRGLAWVNLRPLSARPVVGAIELDLGERGRPRRMALVAKGLAFTVALPEKGGRLRVELPTPVVANCLTAVFDAGDVGDALVPLELGGLRAVATGGAVTVPLLRLAARGEASLSEAARYVATPAGAAEAEALWASQSGDDRLRLAELIGKIGATLPPALRCTLLATASDRERPPLLPALTGRPELATCIAPLLGDRSQSDSLRSASAGLLATIPSATAVTALVARTDKESVALRQARIAALVKILDQQPGLAGPLIDAERQRPSTDGLGVLRLVPRAVVAARPLYVELLGRLATLDLDVAFELLDVVARDADAPVTGALLGLLAAQPALDDLLRWRAVRALAERLAFGGTDDAATPEIIAALSRELASPIPRIQRAALTGLEERRRLAVADAERLVADGWPEVRQRAATALGRMCEAGQVTPAALTDRLLLVAVESSPSGVPERLLESVARCPGSHRAALERLLAERRSSPDLRARAVVELLAEAGPDAAELFASELLRLLEDRATDERAAGLLETLVRSLGRARRTSNNIEKALAAAINEPGLAGLRRVGYEAIAAICPPAGPAALERGRQDPEVEVQRAVERGLVTCHR